MVTSRNRKSFGLQRKNSKSCSDDWHHWCFWSAFRHFGTHFAESFRMSKSSWMMDPTRSREMPNCSAIDLAKICQSSKISSNSWWIWSISGWPLFWVIQNKVHHRWKNHDVWTGPPSFWRWHSMVHASLMFLSEWREFPSAPCLGGKKSLMTACFSMLLKSCASPDMLPCSLCNKKRLAFWHMNRPLFRTTLSNLSYDIRK